MELFNEEGGKLRKKDKIAYYKIGKKLVQVPTMDSDKEEIYEYLKFCINKKYPEISDESIQDEWRKAEGNNKLIIDAMEQLKAEAEASGADIWKVRSYSKAIQTIQGLQVPIVSGEQAIKLPGIGKGMAGVVSEVLKHGKLRTQEERMEAAIERQSVVDTFMKIWDMKPKIANDLYSLGYRSIEDLKRGDIPPKKVKLTDKQRLGIKYYDEFLIPIRTSGEQNDATFVKNEIEKSGVLPKGSKVEIVGDVRRGVETSDIDILIGVSKTSKALTKKLADFLVKEDYIAYKYIPGALTDVAGPVTADKFSGVAFTDRHHKLNVYFTTLDSYGPAMIQHTGPDGFVAQLKEQAAAMGYGIFGKVGFVKFGAEDEKMDASAEKDVFAILGTRYVPPEKR
jgi:DNA polymerase/3'-5' exonuclease PolX